MYLFILESIGTSELIMIGIVALIVFGPRKLPQIARMLGKTMADFRQTTNEFKSTWEKEVNFEETLSKDKNGTNESKLIESSVVREEKPPDEDHSIMSPEIKEVSSTQMEKILSLKDRNNEESQPVIKENDKRSWL